MRSTLALQIRLLRLHADLLPTEYTPVIRLPTVTWAAEYDDGIDAPGLFEIKVTASDGGPPAAHAQVVRRALVAWPFAACSVAARRAGRLKGGGRSSA